MNPQTLDLKTKEEIAGKRKYIRPEIASIEIDNEISLVLNSNTDDEPPASPWEESF